MLHEEMFQRVNATKWLYKKWERNVVRKLYEWERIVKINEWEWKEVWKILAETASFSNYMVVWKERE